MLHVFHEGTLDRRPERAELSQRFVERGWITRTPGTKDFDDVGDGPEGE